MTNSVKDELGYEPKVRDIQSTKDEANQISSKLLDWMDVRGKTSQVGAGVDLCEEVDPDLEKYYIIYHPWSIYDLRKGTFEEAWDNLRRQLPRNGWKITKDGMTKASSPDPEIAAINVKNHYVVNLELMKNRAHGLKDMISVDLTSPCYRAPKGTDISRDR